LTITNSGNSVLTVSGISYPAGFSGAWSGTIAANGSQNVTVTFAPTAVTSYSGTVTVSSDATSGGNTISASGTGTAAPVASFTANPTSGVVPLDVTFTDNSAGMITNRLWYFGDGGTLSTNGTNVIYRYNTAGTNTVSLTVTGPVGGSSATNYIVVTNPPPPLLAVSPTNLLFLPLVVNQSSTQNCQVVNQGGLLLTGSVVTLPPFYVVGGSPFSLSANQTGVVQIAFSPTQAGVFSTNVVFTSNGGNATNTVSGTGVTPAQIAVTPASTNFGSVVLGNYAERTFVVTNLGGAVLSNGVATVGAPFTITSGGAFNLPGFGSTNVVVRFTPASAGSVSSNVVFTTSSAGGSTNAVAGIAVTPGQIAVSPASRDFGILAVGANADRTFMVTNLGGAAVTGGSANSSAPFSIVSGSPFTLAGFGSTNVVVRFTPASAGSVSNNILFITANGGNVTNAVTGMGAVVPVASFTGTPTSGLAPLDVTFTDTSIGTITNRSWNFGDGTPILNTNSTTFLHRYLTTGTNNVSLIVNGPVGTNTLTRNGYVFVTNPPPLLVVTPASRDFGALIIGQTNTQWFSVSNAGSQTLTGTAASSSPFAVLGGSPYSLPPGQTHWHLHKFWAGAVWSAV
jgi:PKD repeat protein